MGVKSPELKNKGTKLMIARSRGRGKEYHFVSLFVLILLFFWIFAGCVPKEKPKVDFSTSEQKRAALLKQLNSKFEDPETHFKVGQLYQADGQWDKAEYHYNIALSFDPVFRDVQAAMVKGLIENGSAAKAKQVAAAYMTQVSNSVTATLQLAQAFGKQGVDEYAVACYQQALQLAPNSSEVSKQFGYYYLSKKNTDKAKEYFSRSFQLNPNQPDVAGELGRLGIVVKIPRPAETETPKLQKKPVQSEKDKK